jgi:ribonucleoside-diphosphate reductase beta chain
MSEYRELYYRWEREQWEAGAIDLSDDRRRWEGLAEDQRTPVLAHVSALHRAGLQTTTTLVPLVDGVGTEEQQVFLTTQLVDTARHIVFLDRFLEEVWLGDAERLSDHPADPDPALTSLLDERLPQVTVARLVEGIRLHHVELEGVLSSILSKLAEAAVPLPGLASGVASMQRDHRRHAEFGRLYLREHGNGQGPG